MPHNPSRPVSLFAVWFTFLFCRYLFVCFCVRRVSLYSFWIELEDLLISGEKLNLIITKVNVLSDLHLKGDKVPPACNQTNVGTVSNAAVGKLFEKRSGTYMDFSERVVTT